MRTGVGIVIAGREAKRSRHCEARSNEAIGRALREWKMRRRQQSCCERRRPTGVFRGLKACWVRARVSH
ncbi:MAG: hypothetical protein LBT00_04410 [Spirochaetaceae bacterium]|nr:hypothetical protein [Spirochaetaceae bacterium]